MTQSRPHAHPPLVSVIIPAFNYAQFIEETLKSVQAQTLDDWECIVVDDGSTDQTPAIVQAAASRDPRIRLIRQANSGQASARKAGLEASAGQYIQLLDADDLIEPAKLQRHSEVLDQHADTDIVYGPARYFPSDNPAERRFALFGPDVPWMPGISGAGRQMTAALLEQNIMAINCPLVRRQVFDDVGSFDASLPRADDWDMWLRCALAGKRFEFRDEPQTLALVRIHPTSLTQRDRRLLEARLAMLRKVSRISVDREMTARAAELLDWLGRVHQFARLLDRLIPTGAPVVLIDNDTIRPELIGHNCLPFKEHDSLYCGPPANDEDAITELERMRAIDVRFVIFAWPALWYLQTYPLFAQHLRDRYRCILQSDIATAFDVQSTRTTRCSGAIDTSRAHPVHP